MAVTADPDRLAELRGGARGQRHRGGGGPEALRGGGLGAGRLGDVGDRRRRRAGAGPRGWRAHGGVLALANKESLVCAGDLLRRTCAAHGTRLIPVDSEHSAIFQALQRRARRRGRADHPDRLGRAVPRLDRDGGWRAATPAQARAHPNWDMGERISIDSATMFNKALEVIEAQALFDVNPERIEVLVHPQSIVHSMVGFRDGSIIAQLGPSDMRGAIGYALNWPERRALPVERLDFAALGRLDFAPADPERFPALRLARRGAGAGRAGRRGVQRGQGGGARRLPRRQDRLS